LFLRVYISGTPIHSASAAQVHYERRLRLTQQTGRRNTKEEQQTLDPHIIRFDIVPTRCNFTKFTYFWKTALHVSGSISTHHQEYTQLYLQYLILVTPLLLPATIVELLELQLQFSSLQFSHGRRKTTELSNATLQAV